MAKLLTKKYQNNNSHSKAFGKIYGRFVYTETLTTDEFVNHIVKHGSPFDRSTIIGVLAVASDCLVELTLDSKRVRLGDLGTFYMSAETEGAEEEKDFTADNIKKVHLRFWPNQSQSYSLDSVSMRKASSFTNIEQLIEGNSNGGNGSSSNGSNNGSNGDNNGSNGDNNNSGEPTDDDPVENRP